jgi:hypothetical protein
MDDSLCQRFFRLPTQRLHRRYEALRAFFLEQRSLQDIARDLGYGYGTLRNLICNFRKQCRDSAIPPFRPTTVRSPGRSSLRYRAGRTRPSSHRRLPLLRFIPRTCAAYPCGRHLPVLALVSPPPHGHFGQPSWLSGVANGARDRSLAQSVVPETPRQGTPQSHQRFQL